MPRSVPFRRSHCPFLLLLTTLAVACSTSAEPRGEALVVGQCADARDNDSNGAVDCLDRNCAGYDGCPSTPEAQTASEGGDGGGSVGGSSNAGSQAAGTSSAGRATTNGGAATSVGGTGAGTSPDATDPTCPGGQTRCDGECVDVTSHPLHCSSCGNVCPGGVCDDGSCTENTNCTETPCAGFSYCDLVDRTCKPGCALDAQCNPNEVCDVASHGCVCDDGFHECTDVCVTDDSVDACGPSCTSCTRPVNSTASCVNDACQFECNGGYSKCGDQCYSDSDVVCDEASCAICTPPANGNAYCSGSQCSFSCNDGFHECGGQCHPDADVICDQDSCAVCDEPANGFAVCSGSACGIDCNEGFAACGDSACAKAVATACTSDDECCASAGQFCQFGECTPYVYCTTTTDEEGLISDDCGDGYMCETLYGSLSGEYGVCTHSCDSDADCEPGPQGTSRTCVRPGDVFSECELTCNGQSDDECPSGMVCKSYASTTTHYVCAFP